jgi:multiple sugar transport system substrate-binding protein
VRALTFVAAALAALICAWPASAQTKLKFYSWQTDDKSNSVWWRASLKQFQADHPGVAVEFIKVNRDIFADTMMVMFGSGTPPDIVHLAAFEHHAFAEQGWLEDLGPWIKKDGVNLEGWAGQDKCVWEGKTVCINLNYFGYILFYNEALLRAAGVAVPKTWEAYLDAARRLTKAGGDGAKFYGVGHHTTAGAGQYVTELLSYVLDAGGYWSSPQGQPTIDTPAVVEGLRRWKLLQQEKLTPLGAKAEDVRQLFIEGRIAMRLDGPWMWGLLDTSKPEIRPAFKMAEPPFRVPVGGTSNVIGMPASLAKEKKQLVWNYIKQVTTPQWQEQYVLLTGQTAPRPHSLTKDALAKMPFLEIMERTKAKAAAAGVDRLPPGFETTYNEFAKIIVEEAQRMVVHDVSPGETAKRIQKRAEALQKS